MIDGATRQLPYYGMTDAVGPRPIVLQPLILGNSERKHGISDATFYKWKAKYGGMEVSHARRLKVLEDENTKLKKLLAEAMLDNAMLRDVASRKW